jgi:hypothetical protein
MGYLWRWAGSSGDTIQAGAFRFPGTQGPLNPAAIQSMSFGGGTVTVTTVNNHNISGDQAMLLAVPSRLTATRYGWRAVFPPAWGVQTLVPQVSGSSMAWPDANGRRCQKACHRKPQCSLRFSQLHSAGRQQSTASCPSWAPTAKISFPEVAKLAGESANRGN